MSVDDLRDARAEEREKPGAALRKIVDRFESLYARHDFPELAQAIESNLLAAYFGVQPEILQNMLDSIIEAGADSRGIARGLMFIFRRGGDHETLEERGPKAVELPYSIETMMLLGKVTELRLTGRSHETSVLMDELDQHMGAVDPLFSDSSGMGLMIPLQAGITAMLAGETKRALDYFTRAQLQPMIPGLAFLTRDAYAKEALLHGAFGRISDAKKALSRAESIPSFGIWVDPAIDATQTLARAFIEAENTEKAVEYIDSISLHALGEMWPYFMIGLRRVLSRAGQYRDLLERVSRFEQIPLTRIPGKGMGGSVFPLARVAISLAAGDLEAARALLKDADPEYVTTKAALVHLELAAGRFQPALRAAERLGADDGTRLWKIDVWRLAGLSAAYLGLDRLEEAREALRTAHSGGLEADDLELFTDDVLDFASANIAGWPPRDAGRPRVADSLPDSSPRLTGREFEVLRMLAQKKSQKQIAQESFVSLNTVKTHIKSIYRKLDVSSRSAALLRAEREGWL